MMKPEPILKNGEPVLVTCLQLAEHDEVPVAQYGLSVPLEDSERDEMRESLGRKFRAMAVLSGKEDEVEDQITELLDRLPETALVDDPFELCWN